MRSNQNRQKRHTEERGQGLQGGETSDQYEEKDQEETHQLELEIEEEQET